MKRFLTTTATLIASAGLVASADAASIGYDFSGNTASATANDFGNGVTALDATTTGGVAIGADVTNTNWSSTYGTEHASVKLQQSGTLVFGIEIPDGVVVDLTGLTFDFNHQSTNPSGNTQVRNDWTLSITNGGTGTPSTDSLQDLAGVINVQTTPDISLNNLTGLTDTTVEFTLTLQTGVNNTLSGGNANDRRLVVDNIVLTGEVVPVNAIPSPSAILFGAAGMGMLAVRRRRA